MLRFQACAHLLHRLDSAQDLDRLFDTRLQRNVRKDGTIRLENQLYEVDLTLRGLDIDLSFDPWTLARIEVSHRGQAFGLARRVDLHLNSQIGAPN